MTKNFQISELECKDGTPVPAEFTANAEELLKNLQVLRDEIQKPIVINSGYRSPDYNKKIGGKPKSFHMKAMAADIKVVGMSPAKVFATIERLINEKRMKQGGLEQYPTFVHYDVRGRRARW